MDIIRPALASDASPILDIYAPYILNTAVSFETEVPTVEDFSKRIISNQEILPWLVFETGGTIAGYAYASKHRERAAYQWSVESSVYVSNDFQYKGIATKLYLTLFEILRYQGCRNVYAGVTLPNEKSIHLHKKMGFNKIADYTNIGYKQNSWHTVSWFHLKLSDYSDTPAPLIKFKEIKPLKLQAILNKSL